MTTPATKMFNLAKTFPSMKGQAAIGQELPPWDANFVDSWAASEAPSSGQRVTAQFLLAVWDPKQEWKSGRFDIMNALKIWDEKHLEAFLAWASAPWWP